MGRLPDTQFEPPDEDINMKTFKEYDYTIKIKQTKGEPCRYVAEATSGEWAVSGNNYGDVLKEAHHYAMIYAQDI